MELQQSDPVFEHLHEKINGSIIISRHRSVSWTLRPDRWPTGASRPRGPGMRCRPSAGESVPACAAPLSEKCGKEEQR